MASHNGEKYIGEQIASIIEQLSQDDELIISDDGSTDNTIQIIKSFNDSRIKLIHLKQDPSFSKHSHSSFYYASANFINALKHVKGDFIFLSDQDDIWNHDKIKICLEELKEADIIKHNYSIANKLGIIEKKYVYNKSKYNSLDIYKSIKYLPFRGCCIAFNRKVLNKCFPFPKKCLQHDSWIALIAQINGFKFKFVDIDLIWHRKHNNNVSELKSPNSLIYKIKYRLILIFQLMNHQIKMLVRKIIHNTKCRYE